MRDLDALIAYLEARQAMPFAWGSEANDCVSFAAGAVEAQTGRNLIQLSGHSWATKRGALRVLHAVGGRRGAADLVLERTPCAFAHRGDVGLAEVGGQGCLMIFEGATLVGPGPEGLVRLPREAASIAWSAEAFK